MLVDLGKFEFGSGQFVNRDLGIRFPSLDLVPFTEERSTSDCIYFELVFVVKLDSADNRSTRYCEKLLCL